MKKKTAYIVSRFPTVSETFILHEIIELRKLGMEIVVFPLIHENGSVIHPEVETIASKVHYTDIFSLTTIIDHFFWIYKNPKTYVKTFIQVFVINLRSLKFLSRAVAVMLQSAQIARKIEEMGIDSIHAHSATHATLMAYIIWKLTGIPYSFTAHSTDIYFNQTMLREKVRQSKFVVTISEYNRNFLLQKYPDISRKKIKVVHCGVNASMYQSESEQKLSSSFNIICVARLEKIKGHKYLIDALAQLKIQNIDFRCFLVGDGELRHQIQAQINRLNLITTVVILGFKTHQQVVELLSQVDIFVLPSLSEGIPVAAMEAMAAGLPVIATSVSGVPELVVDGVTGLLVPSQNSAELAKAFIKLHNSQELRHKLGKAGQSKVNNEFSIQKSTSLLYDIFQNE
jgi:colanic acid/amylovoran biosynthesis glycosyltransferase